LLARASPGSRHHWNRVRTAAGLGDVTLHVATRHYAAWYVSTAGSCPPT